MLILLASCSSQKKVPYFQDLKDSGSVKIATPQDVKLRSATSSPSTSTARTPSSPSRSTSHAQPTIPVAMTPALPTLLTNADTLTSPLWAKST